MFGLGYTDRKSASHFRKKTELWYGGRFQIRRRSRAQRARNAATTVIPFLPTRLISLLAHWGSQTSLLVAELRQRNILFIGMAVVKSRSFNPILCLAASPLIAHVPVWLFKVSLLCLTVSMLLIQLGMTKIYFHLSTLVVYALANGNVNQLVVVLTLNWPKEKYVVLQILLTSSSLCQLPNFWRLFSWPVLSSCESTDYP
jgi:hypothetical protein